MIKATYLDILNALTFMQRNPDAENVEDRGLAHRKGLNIKDVFLPMRRIIRELDGPTADFEEARKQLNERYSDEEGNIQQSDELQKEWDALLATEVEINAEPFKAEALAEAGLSLIEIEVALGPFVAD